MEALNNAWNEASTQMYQQATAGGGQQARGRTAAGPAGRRGRRKPEEKKVEDAQYEVMDDKK